MQCILGANGIIGESVAKELWLNYTKDIRIVGRNPAKINDSDTLFKADLLNFDQTKEAVAGCKIAFLTVGTPYSSKAFLDYWPVILKNVIDACIEHKVKLVYFDNTYMYDQSIGHQTEASAFATKGLKGQAKAIAANLVLEAIRAKKIEAVICRAPEFYGPGKTKGITNSLIFDNIKNGKKLKVFLHDDKKRTLIYTPDAGRATALLGNTTDAYGQTWHLPCDDNRLTYKEFIAACSVSFGASLEYSILKKWLINLVALFNSNLKESKELLPRYTVDNIFDSSKFKKRFPEFSVTSYQEGIAKIISEIKQS